MDDRDARECRRHRGLRRRHRRHRAVPGPTGLYLDTAANVLYIADTGNHAIRALDLGAHTVSTIVNTSHALGFAGDGGDASAALLFEPTALTRCPNGDLFIADTGNNRIRRVAARHDQHRARRRRGRVVGRGRIPPARSRSMRRAACRATPPTTCS